MSTAGTGLSRTATRALRRHLVGPAQRWEFDRPEPTWRPPRITRTSLYLHVPFCRNRCPYCPYTKVVYDEALVAPYAHAALHEIDLWADAVGPAEVTSVYVGGGTPTLAMGAVSDALQRIRERFVVTGDACIETNPADVDDATIEALGRAGIALVSVGVQSFRPHNLKVIGRRYTPEVAERALRKLAAAGFSSVNADIMFALPGQTTDDLITDLEQAAACGADQITTYPLFTFPYTSVGTYLHLTGVKLPDLPTRRRQYRAISQWCARNGFERVSVWGFKRDGAPRYSSVTRDGYVGIGPGSGSDLPDGFTLNTFDLEQWEQAVARDELPIAVRMPFSAHMDGWWWLYWRFYDTRIPLAGLDTQLGDDADKARRWLRAVQAAGLARSDGETLELTDAGAFWLHLAQNHFALSYVNTLWTEARRTPWPESIAM